MLLGIAFAVLGVMLGAICEIAIVFAGFAVISFGSTPDEGFGADFSPLLFFGLAAGTGSVIGAGFGMALGTWLVDRNCRDRSVPPRAGE